MTLSRRIDHIENRLKRMDGIEARLKSEIGIFLANKFKDIAKKLLKFRSLGRIDEFVNLEPIVDSSLSTPQRQEGGHNISPTITPSLPKSLEVTPALHNKSTSGVKAETI